MQRIHFDPDDVTIFAAQLHLRTSVRVVELDDLHQDSLWRLEQPLRHRRSDRSDRSGESTIATPCLAALTGRHHRDRRGHESWAAFPPPKTFRGGRPRPLLVKKAPSSPRRRRAM